MVMPVGQLVSACVLLVGTTTAHMEMKFPAPFNSKFNPYTEQSRIDYSMTNPLATDGSNFPCKGYHSLLGTSAGRPTAEFELGRPAGVTVVGGATHGGGSCQISLSTDGARSFVVLKSIIGGCPSSTDGDIAFTVPADAPAGDAVLAWSWHNRIGNREMYMNCAAVTLKKSSSSSSEVHGLDSSGSGAASFSSRPGLFVANVGNGCGVAEGGDVSYPDPGQDVIDQSTNPVAPAGDCGSSSPPPPPPPHVGSGGSGPGASRRPTTTLLTTTRAPPPESVPTVIAGSGSSGIGSPDGAGAGSDSPHNESPKSGSSGSGSPNSGSPSTGSIASGQPCTDEGIWNCLPGGRTFQRCASGLWSVEMPMAAGTGCNPGLGYNFEVMDIRY